jgi:hypothetical protein
MKKLLSVIAIAGVCTLVACGPSKEEQAKMEQARQDSIAKVVSDSTAAAQAAAMAKMTADSLAAAQAKATADSLAAANMPKGKKKK